MFDYALTTYIEFISILFNLFHCSQMYKSEQIRVLQEYNKILNGIKSNKKMGFRSDILHIENKGVRRLPLWAFFFIESKLKFNSQKKPLKLTPKALI